MSDVSRENQSNNADIVFPYTDAEVSLLNTGKTLQWNLIISISYNKTNKKNKLKKSSIFVNFVW